MISQLDMEDVPRSTHYICVTKYLHQCHQYVITSTSVQRLTNADFMAISESALCLQRVVHDIASDVEHGLIAMRIRSGRNHNINRRTGFLVVLLQIVIEHIVGTTGTIVEPITESVRLDKIKYRTVGRYKNYTSGTADRSGGKPANFGVVHWWNVHQQSGSDEG